MEMNLVDAQKQWYDRNGWPLDLNAVYAENEFKGDSSDLVAAQKWYMERLDGGPGSGNWGHSGRPGVRGGSGAGGGAAYRLTTPTGGYTGLVGAYKENVARSKNGNGGKTAQKSAEQKNSKLSRTDFDKEYAERDNSVKNLQSQITKKLNSYNEPSRQEQEYLFSQYKEAAEKRNELARKQFSAVDDCESVNDVNAYMRAQGFFKEGVVEKEYMTILGFKQTKTETLMCNEVDLNGCDAESAKGICKAYEMAFNEFPEVKGKLYGIQAKKLMTGVMGQCITMDAAGHANGSISVNTDYVGSSDRVNNAYANCVKRGFHPEIRQEISGAQVTVVHEIGHAIDGYISETYTNHTGEKQTDTFATDVLRKVSKKNRMTQKAIKESISGKKGYAVNNNREFFAEAIASALCGSNPSQTAKDVLEETKAMVKGGTT